MEMVSGIIKDMFTVEIRICIWYPQYTVDIDLSKLEGPEGDSSYGWKEEESGVVYSSTDQYTTTKKYVDFYPVEVTPSPTPTPVITPTPTPVIVPSQSPTQTTPAPVIPPTYPTTPAIAITKEEEQDEANPEWDEDYEEEETATSKKTTKKTVTQFTVRGLKYKVLKTHQRSAQWRSLVWRRKGRKSMIFRRKSSSKETVFKL